ncbi:MAG: hypothetical protein RLN90_01845 [Balneolaceae bacterium]
MKLSLFLFITIAAFSCKGISINDSEKVIDLGEEFEIRLNETLLIADTGQKIQLINIIDNRCNVENIVCVWSGDATIALLIDNSRSEHNLYYPKEIHSWNVHSTSNEKFKIEFKTLSPQIRINSDTSKEDYFATLIIHKK